ncbi:putative homeodomain transcription factor isoform X2 [Zootermopsis nevadensis]|nr:putative homeodomain transcription factor isoform X2 [Zootermopsis nevadensis]XP_021928813.1 putative homeodomain transcription factor isoform X2 [Zootermopsis nevadensis]XP_021928814.1 putative homeodomain transcription factor isoform X2 [Zootermopsis nevadensis]XP_021928815.1 putative homeodomain transcription factor isoform X2 [Zootermopsis nevadensis]
MGLREIVTWYQKKIGTYDKQQWEKTIEQRILHGLTHVPKKTAKLKTELIDVDLVRGSSFPKAKPKHGLLTVTRLAALRLLLLPVYSRWWIQQTSPTIYALLLLMYVLQLISTALYCRYCAFYTEEDSAEQHVSASEVLVPGAMMLVLSLIHSQIVSTHTGPARHLTGAKSRRVKRTKRRLLFSSRSRTVCSDSKSSPDTGSEKATSVGELGGSKYSKRAQLRRSSAEIVRRRVVAWDTSGKGKFESHLGQEGEKDRRVNSEEQRQAAGGVPANARQRVRLQVVPLDRNAHGQREATPLDDDGFESLNGNGSSENGEEATEDAEEAGGTQCKIAEDLGAQSRSSLNWKSSVQDSGNFSVVGEKQNERSRSSLNYSSQWFEGSLQSVKFSSSYVTMPTLQITQHIDILRFPDGQELTAESVSHVGCLKNDTFSDEASTILDPIECSETKCKVPTGDNIQKLVVDSSAEHGHKSSQRNTLTNESKHTRLSDSSEDEQHTPFRKFRMQDVSCRSPSADSDTDITDAEIGDRSPQRERLLVRRSGSQVLPLSCGQQKRGRLAESSYNSSCESEEGEVLSSPGTGGGCCPLLAEGAASAGEWIGVTTNSEECSYSSELEESDSQQECNVRDSIELNDHPFASEFELSPTVILSPSCAASDRVSCTVWESRDVKKADLSVLDISSAIIARVESMPENMDYFYVGVVMAIILSLLPSLCRLSDVTQEVTPGTDSASPAAISVTVVEITGTLLSNLSGSLVLLLNVALGNTLWERMLVLIALFERFMLSTLFFFLLAVAERTFKQRFLYAKLFSHLTSFRRARKSELPHFRLNKVRNIKTWLSVRSYLKKRGPQRSVDVIVSAAFLITLLLLSFLSVECLKVSVDIIIPHVGVELTGLRSSAFDSVRLHSEYNLEALVWCLVLGVFLLRFMTLGTKINRKYRNLSVLITEQINLYLQIEQKPNKKEELMVANSVLKLAADLLKELESPFKISGLSANPYLYTITKVVILSALSGVLSEMLGFKLKLHKIKIK